MSHKKEITNWGKYPFVEADFKEPEFQKDVESAFNETNDLIVRGNGRCYGDSSLGNNILSTLKFDKILGLNEETGIISCQSGVLLSDILEAIVPKGFFLPITPGTKFITIGGAVAADVHGKNHHVDGSFSDHILTMDVMTANGEVVSCSRSNNKELFWLTCGGMGLTGIILQVTFILKRIESAYIKQRSIKAKNIDEIIELFEQTADTTYSVAWIDCLAKGKKRGKSILMVGEHAKKDELPNKYSQNPLHLKPKGIKNIPFNFPGFVLNPLSIKLFNKMFYAKQQKKEVVSIIDYDTFFYPLDAILNWNRMYGKSGFTQYQFVLPQKNGKEGMLKILDKIAASGQGSFLAVLKAFGRQDPNSIMSFPMKGLTLALDFKIQKKLFGLLDALDEIVAEYNGRIYLAKDVRMTPEMLFKTYEKSEKFKQSIKELNNGKLIESLQSKRLKIT